MFIVALVSASIGVSPGSSEAQQIAATMRGVPALPPTVIGPAALGSSGISIVPSLSAAPPVFYAIPAAPALSLITAPVPVAPSIPMQATGHSATAAAQTATPEVATAGIPLDPAPVRQPASVAASPLDIYRAKGLHSCMCSESDTMQTNFACLVLSARVAACASMDHETAPRKFMPFFCHSAV